MVARLWLSAQTSILCLIPVGIALAGIGSDLAPARAALPPHTPGTVQHDKSPARTLRLQNNTSSQVRVEVRVGPDKACDALGTLGVQVLRQGQEWTVQFDDQVICWRRDQTPGDPASRWAAWNLVRLADGNTRIVTL